MDAPHADHWDLIRRLHELDVTDDALRLVGGEAAGYEDIDLAPDAIKALEMLRGMDPELDEALDNHSGWTE